MALYSPHTIIGAPVDRSRYLTHGRALPTLCTTPQNALRYTVVYYDIYRSRPMALYSSHTIIGAPVDRSRYLTHGRALPTLCATPQNAPKIHSRVLWHIPITTDGFIFVPHYYWGAGRPKLVSGTTPTAVLCPPSGFQFRLHVGSRSNPIQSLNQYQINIWLYDTFLHNKIWYFVLSCYANTLSPLW